MMNQGSWGVWGLNFRPQPCLSTQSLSGVPTPSLTNWQDSVLVHPGLNVPGRPDLSVGVSQEVKSLVVCCNATVSFRDLSEMIYVMLFEF